MKSWKEKYKFSWILLDTTFMTDRISPENKSGSESAESTETLNGPYGLVIIPDRNTQEITKSKARELFPDAEFHVPIPHITLYHTRLKGLPLQTLMEIRERLRVHRGDNLQLGPIEIYGGNFAFWNIDPIPNSLREMHEQALLLAEYIDRTAPIRALEEGLKMTPKEFENAKKYNHPLVKELFRPHITLAADSRGLVLPPGTFRIPRVMRIEDVALGEIGDFGSVARVVELQ